MENSAVFSRISQFLLNQKISPEEAAKACAAAETAVFQKTKECGTALFQVSIPLSKGIPFESCFFAGVFFVYITIIGQNQRKFRFFQKNLLLSKGIPFESKPSKSAAPE